MNKKIEQLKTIKFTTNKKYQSQVDEVIKLFSERKIEKFKTAEKLAIKLGLREKAPESAFKELATYNKTKKSINS